jgi:D-glycero-D-manno-heptose 1,7-bisphosphate phosphatase
MKKVIILDRDGVINKKPPKAEYVKSWDEFEILPGVIEALQLLDRQNYDIFIVTNQAGIARGLITENDLHIIHKKLLDVFKQNNVHIKDIYYCPHGWDEGCDCRKPKPGMLLRAGKEHNFDITKAIFIGDDERDKQAGDAAGCKTILIPSNENLLKTIQSIANL